MPTYIYILHIEIPLSHARHYMGSTQDLEPRLAAHAQGRGARLTQVLLELSMKWQLGGLFQEKDFSVHSTGRKAERKAKNNHSGPTYCEICSGKRTRSIPGFNQIPLASVQDMIPTTSDALAKKESKKCDTR